MGDFSIDVTNKGIEFDRLEEFCDLFNLTDLVTSSCCTKILKSTINLILTSKENCFQKTKVTETGWSNFHKLISTLLQSYFSQLNHKTIYYRNCKIFNEQKFLKEARNANFCFNWDDPNDIYELITDLYSKIVNKHPP